MKNAVNTRCRGPSTLSTSRSHSIMGSSELHNLLFNSQWKKLNGRNYREWAQPIKLVVDGNEELRYLTGEKRKSTSNDIPLLLISRLENSMVTVWLVNSMKPSIEKIYIFRSMLKDFWDAIQDMHSNTEKSSKIFESTLSYGKWSKAKGKLQITT